MRRTFVPIIILLSVVSAFTIFHFDGGKDVFGVQGRYECLEEIRDRISREPRLYVSTVGLRLGDQQMLLYMFSPCYVSDTPSASALHHLIVCSADKSDSVYAALGDAVEWYSRDCDHHFLLLKNLRE